MNDFLDPNLKNDKGFIFIELSQKGQDLSQKGQDLSQKGQDLSQKGQLRTRKGPPLEIFWSFSPF
jgi:hypothetical protein